MNVSELCKYFLELMPKEDEGEVLVKHRRNGTVSFRYIWKDSNARYGTMGRILGEADLDRHGNISKLHPNEEGPYLLVDAFIQAYNTNMPGEG